jgi:hypothetical protein
MIVLVDTDILIDVSHKEKQAIERQKHEAKTATLAISSMDAGIKTNGSPK